MKGTKNPRDLKRTKTAKEEAYHQGDTELTFWEFFCVL